MGKLDKIGWSSNTSTYFKKSIKMLKDIAKHGLCMILDVKGKERQFYK